MKRYLLHAAGGIALAILSCAGVGQAQQEVSYEWERVFYGVFEGKQALLYNDSAFHGKPAFGDLDGDGDLDLLIGKLDGRINRYENRGRPGAPDWRLLRESVPAVVVTRSQGGILKRRSRQIDVGTHAAPALVDIDQDGDLDLVVGSASGKLFFFRNTGTDVLFVLDLVSDAFVAPNFGRRVVPTFADINGDLAHDLFIGNGKGDVFLLTNKGNKKRAAFCAKFPARNAKPGQPPPCRPVPVKVTSLAPESNAAPALVDWDGDGDLDLFVGKRNGTIAYYENRGTPRRPAWKLQQARFLSIDNGGYAAPAFMDVNGDNQPDLLAGTNNNNVFLYTNKDTGQLLDVWKVTGNLLSVRRLGRDQTKIAMTSGDLDGDGDLDLVIGGAAGNLSLVENTGSKQVPAWRIKRNNLFAGTLRRNTTPFLVDIDQDGDLDLIVGGSDGKLWLVENYGDAKRARWRLADTNFAGIDVGSGSVPALRDMDGDGDLDLIVGNSRGLVIYFVNEGSKNKPNYRLVNTRFAGIAVGRDAAPALFDWNQDKLPDLIVGNRTGVLALAVNRNKNDDADLRKWKIISRNWEKFQVKGGSIPHFNDFNGDGRPDLMLGDKEGNLRLWLNGGMQRLAAADGKKGEQPSARGAGGAPAATPQDLAEGERGESEETLVNLARLLAASELPKEPIPPQFTLVSRDYGGLKFRGRSAPAFADLDGDGDQDMVVGTRDGKLVQFRNEGPLKNPKWRRLTSAFSGYKHGRNSSPLFADLDGDQQLDLLVGTEDGRVYFFKGNDKRGVPEFVLQKGALAAINVGRNASPALLSIQGSKSPLLLVGNFAGRLMAYGASKPGGPLQFKRMHRQYMGMDVGVSATPYVTDIDRDGILDMLVGSDQGNVLNFKRIPTTAKIPWGWQKGSDYLKSLKFPAGSTPRVTDIDDDGDPDLFLGTERGSIYFYRNDANPREPK